MTLTDRLAEASRRLEAIRSAETRARAHHRTLRDERLRVEGVVAALTQLRSEEAVPADAEGARPNIDVRPPEPAA